MQWWKPHIFKELLGKVYTPFADRSVYSLALDKDPAHETENRNLLHELNKHFYLAECPLGNLPDDALEDAVAQGAPPSPEGQKEGVLMVMMEQYAAKSLHFLPHGKLAIGIKWTKDSMEIVEHIKSIGYVLFHHRSDQEQHLFAVKGDCAMLPANELEEGRYRNMKTTEMYLAVDIDASAELDASQLSSKKKAFTGTTRYDAQYATLADLSSSCL